MLLEEVPVLTSRLLCADKNMERLNLKNLKKHTKKLLKASSLVSIVALTPSIAHAQEPTLVGVVKEPPSLPLQTIFPEGFDIASIPDPPPLPERIFTPIRFTPEDTLTALQGASRLVRCLVDHEVGGGTAEFAPYDPTSVGAAGEIGAAQLHPRGLLNDFYRQGFSNPNNPYEAVQYMEEAIRRGLAGHWSTLRYCR
jgi:hypothetical protein